MFVPNLELIGFYPVELRTRNTIFPQKWLQTHALTHQVQKLGHCSWEHLHTLGII